MDFYYMKDSGPYAGLTSMEKALRRDFDEKFDSCVLSWDNLEKAKAYLEEKQNKLSEENPRWKKVAINFVHAPYGESAYFMIGNCSIYGHHVKDIVGGGTQS